jgi:AraC-like DNA-binding protein
MIELNTISEIHAGLGLPKPKHPLISITAQKDLDFSAFPDGTKVRSELFQIWLKEGAVCQFGYGRNTYDFQEGTLAFSKPGQVITSNETVEKLDVEGYLILFHPDLIRRSNLGKTISEYTFFNYEVSEALHVSDEERKTLELLIGQVNLEIDKSIDAHSQNLIVSTLELFLGYCRRYYDRQFIVRSNLNKDLISSFEKSLSEYYTEGKALEIGLPTVAFCAEELNMSPNYLSDLLKKETGSSAQYHIQDFVINKAKNRLLSSNEPLKMIAFDLGFEYSQHFSNMFKKRTGMTPSEFRTMN